MQIMSIAAQLTELKEYAIREGLEIVASFEEAKTAKEPGRRVFVEMLEMLEQGKANGILAWHPDRLARNSIDGGRIIHMIDKGILKGLRFPTFTFEKSPQGLFMLNLAFGQSKLYVDQLSENVKRGMRHKIRRGEWPSLAPIGYLNNPRTRNIQPDPEKAPIVRKAFELYATGVHTLYTIADELKRMRLTSHSGKSLAVSSVQVLLQNPIYYGAMRFHGELHPGSFEPLISRELFDKVQAVMKSRAKKQRRRKHQFPFIGFLKCAECDCAITAELQRGHHYYRCTHKRGKCSQRKYLREESLLEQVREIVEQLTLPEEWGEKMLAKLGREKAENKSSSRAAVQHLRSEKENIEKKLEDLLDLRLEGVLGTDEYVSKKNKLISRKVEIEQKIAKAETEGDPTLESARNIILRSLEGKKLLDANEPEAFPLFLRNAGSNFLLQGRSVQWQPKNGWRAVFARPYCAIWSGRLDSNQRPPAPKAGTLAN